MARARGKAPTILDIAAAAGGSKSAVSRALSGQGEVSAETRERVERAARELGYVANAMARGLVSSQTRTVGVLLRDMTRPFYAWLQVAMQRAAEHRGYRIVTVTSGLPPLPVGLRQRNSGLRPGIGHRDHSHPPCHRDHGAPVPAARTGEHHMTSTDVRPSRSRPKTRTVPLSRRSARGGGVPGRAPASAARFLQRTLVLPLRVPRRLERPLVAPHDVAAHPLLESVGSGMSTFFSSELRLAKPDPAVYGERHLLHAPRERGKRRVSCHSVARAGRAGSRGRAVW
ncbi:MULTISPECIES: LacI family DNA-binding transcriptional regulator [Streptomyces]|uniref:LacI family DNA-binding transcriptional regulator n=1 Tax=Streptomyces lycopersici TaxID=2974589 RepID=UPI0035250B45